LDPRDDDKMHSLKYVTLISDMDAARKRFNVTVNTHFGMTEAGVPFGRNNVTDNFSSCGRVKPGYEVRLVDDLDFEVPVGEVGELIVRNAEPWTLSQGYFGKPEKTIESWRNGWLHTGDALRRDAEGNYYFVDRKRDYMRRRGENISSFEVEAIVSQHPELAEVAAIGVPSEHGEDEVKIVVVRRDGSALTHEELLYFLIPRMPRFMVPRYIEFAKTLPRTPATQHVRKVELRVTPLNKNTWDREAAGIEIPR
jgi:crotonobetaine/carnitine-CoA ligase